MRVRIRCFAAVRELFAADELTREVDDGTTLADLRRMLEQEFPAFASLPTAQAVNRDYAEGSQVLRDGDEVAFIPPISGGADSEGGEPPRFRFMLSEAPLEPRPLEDDVRTDHDGAVVTFSGVTRDHNDGNAVLALEYEAYAEMAEAEMDRVFTDTAAKFGDGFGRVRVAHRLGAVGIGEASVLVVAAAAHRGPAFDVARFVMDSLKTRVPIFKRELLADAAGTQRWVGDLPSR